MATADVVETDQLVSQIHENAVPVLHARIVAPGRPVVAVDGLSDDRAVVEDARGHGLPVRVLGTVRFETVIAHSRALRCIQTTALHEQTKLAFATPTLPDVDAVI